MSRELLQKALEELERIQYISPKEHGLTLRTDIRAELGKPEPVDCGIFEITNEDTRRFINLPDGKYRLLAEKIND